MLKKKVEMIAAENYRQGKTVAHNPFIDTKWESVWLEAFKAEKRFWEQKVKT